MYFQDCSNPAYPQHSGERHRTNGPLVLGPLILLSILKMNECHTWDNLSV